MRTKIKTGNQGNVDLTKVKDNEDCKQSSRGETVGKSKISVVVRKRQLADGVSSLYLDINTNGKRTRENLQLYIFPGNSKLVKEQNDNTLLRANEIALHRKEELSNPCKHQPLLYASDITFLDYFKQKAAEKKGDNESKWRNHRNVLRILENYCKDNMTFNHVTRKWIEGFKSYLNEVIPNTHETTTRKQRYKGEKLSFKTQQTYFSIFRQCIVSAYNDRLIANNPFTGANAVVGYKNSEYKRRIIRLDWADVKKLYDAPCDSIVLKQAFLLSCYTGLRFMDIANMTWSAVTRNSYGHIVITIPVKMSDKPQVVEIPQQAESFLGTRQSPDNSVYEGLVYNAAMLRKLRMWGMSAGMQKDFTFYTARHSYIFFLLESGLQPYTVSDIMGFREKRNIDIYVNQLKEEVK